MPREPAPTRDAPAPPRPAGTREWALFVLLACIWSLSFVLIKVAVETLPPANLASGRLALAATVLLLYLAARGRPIPLSRHHLGHYLFIGLFGNALPFYLIGWGEQTIDAGLAAIFMGLMPLMTPLLAHYLVPDEPMSAARFGGITLGFCGLLALVGPQSLAGLGTELGAQLAVLGGALCYASTTIYTRRRAHMPGPELAAGATGAGTLLLLPLAWLEAAPMSLAPAPMAWAAMAILGLFATGLATLIYIHLIRTIGASRFSQINYVIPVLGALLGALLLGESLAWNAWLGLGLILAGVVVVNRSGSGRRR